jgi:hypothetical protein
VHIQQLLAAITQHTLPFELLQHMACAAPHDQRRMASWHWSAQAMLLSLPPLHL